MLIDDTLEELDGVLSTRTSVRSATSTVRADPQRCRPDDVVTAIAELGYQACLKL
jgi:copper chaperone CopZ